MGLRVSTLCLATIFFLITAIRAQSPSSAKIRHAVQIQDTLYLTISPPLSDIGDLAVFIDGRDLPIHTLLQERDQMHAILAVVDISKSMSQRNMKYVRISLAKMSHGLDSNALLGIATLGDSAHVHVYPSANHEHTLSWTDSLRVKTNTTNLRHGLRHIILWLRDQTRLPPERSIILYTDGLEDTQYGLSLEELKDVLGQAGIPIHVFPVREPHADGEAEIAMIAHASGGNVLSGFSSMTGGSDEDLKRLLTRRSAMRIPLPEELCDGDSHILEVILERQDESRRLRRPITLGALPDEDSMARWLIPAFGIFITIVAILLIVRKKLIHAQHTRERLEHTVDINDNTSDPAAAIDLPQSVRITLFRIGRQTGSEITWEGSKDEVIVGKRTDCDIVISDDDHISAHHCRLSIFGKDIVLYDMDSTNGTFVNGVRIAKGYLLSPDDVIQLGSSEYRFQIIL